MLRIVIWHWHAVQRNAGSPNNRCLCVNLVWPILNRVGTVSSFLLGKLGQQYGQKDSNLLLSHKHILLRRLKAHVGYLGTECVDQLAKEAITKGNPFFLPKPISYLKSEIRSAVLSIWQDNWDNGETGRSRNDIVPRVSNKPVGWNREEIMFVTGQRPFPSYLHRFNLRTHDN
ncbi:hypothetical protein AVEN_266060-1 [Araneus ventricosus]|uniref:RNase H type-1 domain-containing protein n=1 Tax=Araneus ventricosus TaxID=182803 RepID=A0A4Y2LVU4_ARAVE|nr:hypothetical protein AVEN_266060-1 [Araneus ventricosus]